MPGMLRHEQSDAQVSCGARGIEAAIKRAIREFGITEPERRKRLAAYRVGYMNCCS
jgi:hypothetical protein